MRKLPFLFQTLMDMNEEPPHELNATRENMIKPEITEFTTRENVKVQIVNIGGQITRMGYEIENRKYLGQGLPPALTRIVHKENFIENGCYSP
jgi:hypothetical protein